MPTPAADPSLPSAQNPAAGVGMAPDSLSNLGKICALGVRIKRGVSLHGLALNLTTDLTYFNLINPCGLNRPVTSLQQLLRKSTPAMGHLKQSLTRHFLTHFTHRT